MCLKQISLENKEKEDDIQKKVFSLIDNNKSLIFNSGAGSGKTYALIEGLKYIINTYGKLLRNQNQKIICITFTNVATNEVKERLGASDLVLVSTIHTRIWDIIKRYNKLELLQIHKEKLEEEVIKLDDILNSEKCEEYRVLSSGRKSQFATLIKEKEELYYSVRNKNAAQTRSAFEELLVDYDDILISIGRFKKTVDTIYKIYKYKLAISSIEEKKAGFREVKYTDNYNLDVLHKMRISHDTLLEYGFKMVDRYDALKRIIIDQYPYFLVDEYQDTSPQVIKILLELMRYAEIIGHNFFTSFFGDKAQNIYNTGADTQLYEYSTLFEVVDKPFNRRSAQEVITTINKIRDDEIEQVSIYNDCIGGSVDFFQGTDVISFIDTCKKDWEINGQNKLHCFVLTNATVAKYSGFEDLYNYFRGCGRYNTGLGFEQLTTETLNDDITKLGEAQLQVFKIIFTFICVNNPQIALNKTLVDKVVYSRINFSQLQSLISDLLETNGSTLGEYVQSLLAKASEGEVSLHYKLFATELFGENINSLQEFRQYLADKLVGDEDTIAATNNCIDDLLNCTIAEFEKWANYILRIWNNDIVYHTYHGTKGLEFKNVVIIMGNAFGRDNHFFDFYFKNINSTDNLSEYETVKFQNAKNLLYVSCSRAIKNLRILYIDDISEFSVNIEELFAKVNTYIP